MAYLEIFVTLIVLVSDLSADTEIHGELFGRGVCSILRTDSKSVPVTSIIIKGDETWEFCWHWPPWCSVVERYIHDQIRTHVNIPHDHLILKCCSGFKKNLNATACVPVCSPLCEEGSCVDPDVCVKCIVGYSGPKCIKDSPNGSKSDERLSNAKLCRCPNVNFECNFDSKCVCAPGFEGPLCNDMARSAYVIDDQGRSCVYYTIQAGVCLLILLLSLILLIFIIRKRYFFREQHFEPLDDSSSSQQTTLSA